MVYRYAWNSATIIGLFCGFGGNILLWLGWNYYKKDDALIPVSMVARTTVWSSCLVVGFLMSSLYIATYYLPVYFQAVKNASPTMSGVYMLPSILIALVFAVVAGRAVSVVGYYTPFALASAVFMAIGYGLTATLGPHSSTGDWVGFQLLFGVGRGMGMQMPIVAVQNNLKPTMAPLAIALCMFTGMLFGALFLSASATIFTNSLRTLIPKFEPQADVQAIVVAGATGFRAFLPADQLPGVLKAYTKSVNRVFYLTTALAAFCLIFAFGMGFKNIKPKEADKKDKKKAEDAEKVGEVMAEQRGKREDVEKGPSTV